MIDYVGVITTGGVVLLSKYLEEETKQHATRLETVQFIRETFLAEKIGTEKKFKINQHVFIYEEDTATKMVYIVCFPESFQSPIFQKFLTNLMTHFRGIINGKTHHLDLVNIFSYQPDLWDHISEILYQTFSEEEDRVKCKDAAVPVDKISDKKTSSKPKHPVSTKVQTQWDPLMQSSNKSKVTKEVENKLNYNKDKSGEESIENFREKYLDTKSGTENDSFIDLSSDDDDNELKIVKPSLFSRFKTSIGSLSQGKTLDEKTIKPIMDAFREDLIKKNVACEIADKICENLIQKLLKSKSELLTSTKSLVKSALKDSITSILTPKNNIDLLALALKKKEEGRPFVVTFIGVNGVGKSTNLAKVGYLFKTNGFSVLLAACDNFRSGAVEQLKKHAECLQVPIFERGYKDDSANIARDAIAEASQKKIDVVLIDTAGRMQDNEPLMKALARLVNSNNPDIVLFIGEALTGNDGVDQLVKFNSALKELSAKVEYGMGIGSVNAKGREIDGILLSKFDTVDDKVGAALSLTYATGKPLVYLGVGQKYQNLQKPNIDMVVKSLLK